MIVVDTSVWVSHFRNDLTAAVATFRRIPNANQIVVGDIVLLECLQGARDEAHAAVIQGVLAPFQSEAMLDASCAVEAARNYRTLRALGVTPRKTADVIIATFCIKRGYALLHQDRDFEPMAAHLGLRVL